MLQQRTSITSSDVIMYAALFLAALLFGELVFAQAFPEPIRDTPYDWRCVGADGALVSNHTRQDKAIVACQKAAMANPGVTHYVEAGRYRVIYGTLPIEPPIDPVPPPVDPPIEPPLPGPPEQLPVAVYAYTIDADGELIDPKPLEGAHLARTVVYLAFDGAIPSKVKYWCCKSDVEGHTQGGSDEVPPLVHPVDLSLLMETTASHEFYADMFWPDGTTTWGHIGSFTVAPSVTPPAEPPIEAPTSATLEWTIPATREDGAELLASELWGYIILARYNGGDAVFYEVAGGDVTSYQFDALASGEWLFAIKAIDTGDLESSLSAWVSLTIE